MVNMQKRYDKNVILVTVNIERCQKVIAIDPDHAIQYTNVYDYKSI